MRLSCVAGEGTAGVGEKAAVVRGMRSVLRTSSDLPPGFTVQVLQGYLTYKKHPKDPTVGLCQAHPPWTLP